MDGLEGKVILVTGGASGIGAGVCAYLERRGAVPVAADIKVPETGPQVGPQTGNAIALDVTDEGQWQRAVDELVERFGRIDGLVHAAGILAGPAIVDFDLDLFKKVLSVNLSGTFLAIKHVAPVIGRAGGGAIVVFSSVEGLQGSNSMGAYGSSKWAVRGLGKVAAIELGEMGVRVNSVHPGPINTPMVNPQARPASEFANLSMLDRMAIARLGEVEEVAALCAYLLSDEAKFVTGAEFTIDGGLTAGNRLFARSARPAG